MKYEERAIVMEAAACALVGVLATSATAGETGVVVVVGGPQYRVGSHRQFVHLARCLAEHGYPTLRFDCRGMGDSEGAPPGFEAIAPDLDAAVTALLREAPSVRRVVLWGLCDGASAALLYVLDRTDHRITGLCLANPWVRTEQTQARVQVRHYYMDRLRSRDFWKKVFSGQIGWRSGRELGNAVARSRSQRDAEAFPERMAAAWRAFDGEILLLLSGRDYTAKEFLECAGGSSPWKGALNRERLQRRDLEDADHTFSSERDRLTVEEATVSWLDTRVSQHRPQGVGRHASVVEP